MVSVRLLQFDFWNVDLFLLETVPDLEIFKGGGDFFEGRGDYREKPFFEAHLR